MKKTLFLVSSLINPIYDETYFDCFIFQKLLCENPMRLFYLAPAFALIIALAGYASPACAAAATAEMSVSVRVLEIPGAHSSLPSAATAPSTGTFSTPPGNAPPHDGHAFAPADQYRYVTLNGRPLTNRDGVFP